MKKTQLVGRNVHNQIRPLTTWAVRVNQLSDSVFSATTLSATNPSPPQLLFNSDNHHHQNPDFSNEIKRMDAVHSLPCPTALSPSVLSFLNSNLTLARDLDRAPEIGAELEQQCSGLDQSLIDLNRRLESSLLSYASHSDQLGGIFSGIDVKLSDLESVSRISSLSNPDEGGEKMAATERILGEELPALAKEVARVENVRAYAETTLKLDTMVGDVEDAVSSVMGKNIRNHASAEQSSEEGRLLAIHSIKLVEEFLSSVVKKRPQWTHLVSAVDHRVDRALAILRPQAIADHRRFLTSLGWPPPLSTMNSVISDTRESTADLNPLFTMQGELKHQYCESFLAICRLQELQRQRKSRQLVGYKQEVVQQNPPLWAIEELAQSVSSIFHSHFSKWTDKPEFIFALVYKVARDYIDSMDELLQPLVDRAMLTGYSCREEWISAMVSSLSTYLAKELFPVYISQLEEEGPTGNNSAAKIQWLNLIDLMISFDRRIQSLVAQSGILLQEDESLQRTSSLSVFSDRPDWLHLWAEIELSDATDKLKKDAANEKNWLLRVDEVALEDYKAPAVCGAFIQLLSSVVDRCQSLPNILMRSQMVRLVGVPLVQNFMDCILQRCQEAEGLTALTDDNAIIKVTISINAAHYLESVFKEWAMDFFFLEMGSCQDEPEMLPGNLSSQESPVEGSSDGIFDEEIRRLEKFRIEWVEKVAVVILRGFNAQCRDYMKNRRQWQEKLEEGWVVTPSFVVALDYLQAKMSLVEQNLNAVDFVGFWRNLAAAVDRLIFNGIIISNARFHDKGTERLSGDLQILFGVFRTWSLRPEVFFPKSSEGLKLLKSVENDLQQFLAAGEKAWLRDHGINGLSVAEAEKIAKSRVFTG